jgi:serine/threonine protein phosphatase 1
MLYAVGDIHGETGHLTRLLARIHDDATHVGIPRPRVVFVGDYGDRGPDSRGVYELLTSPELRHEIDPVFLMGNHEDWLLNVLNHRPNNTVTWLHNGGAELVESYGFAFKQPPHQVLPRFINAFPPRHKGFLEGLKYVHVEDGFLFVHAGIDPTHPTSREPAVLFWIRKPFLECEDTWPWVVVHGHTPGDEVVIRSNRVCVDTGCGHKPTGTRQLRWPVSDN